jgi:hypothetical protein
MAVTKSKISAGYRVLCVRFILCSSRHITHALFLSGIILLSCGLAGLAGAQRDPEPATDTNPEIGGSAMPEITFMLPIPEPAIMAPIEDNAAPFDDTLMRNGTGNLFMLIEGAFGALIMVAAGLGAIVAAVLGAYRMAFALLFIAVGAFILRSLVSLFFGTNYPAYSGGDVITVPIP